jgi:hypothetical protein
MASPIAYGKGTKRNKQIGEYGLKRSGGAGKGPVIKDSFGDGWQNNVLERLEKRCLPCSKCGVSKPEGPCGNEACGYIPEGNRGW